MSVSLVGALWPPGSFSTHVALDCAADPVIFDWVSSVTESPYASCLLSGELSDDLVRVAPHVLQLDAGSAFARWFLGSWGKNYGVGVVVKKTVDPSVLRQHLTRVARVSLPDGGGAACFRFYDPRVLREHIKKATPQELNLLFGPIEQFVMESDIEHQVTVFHTAHAPASSANLE